MVQRTDSTKRSRGTTMSNKISKKFKKMAILYRYFSKDWEHLLDYSDKAMSAMYEYESYGTKLDNADKNGYAVGKKWMDVNVAMWKEDIEKGNLWKHELYEQGPNSSIFNEWLDKVLKD